MIILDSGLFLGHTSRSVTERIEKFTRYIYHAVFTTFSRHCHTHCAYSNGDLIQGGPKK